MTTTDTQARLGRAPSAGRLAQAAWPVRSRGQAVERTCDYGVGLQCEQGV